MKEQISELLAHRPGLKAREIAKNLQLDRTAVNSCLYEHEYKFKKDDAFRWSLSLDTLQVEFAHNRKWLDIPCLENTLKQYPEIWSDDIQHITFSFPNYSFLISTLSRILALVNQLCALKGKSIKLDFSQAQNAFGYLCRVGWFDLVDKNIQITPTPTKQNERYGQNQKLMEFVSIDSREPDENIPIYIKKVLATEVGKDNANLAFTYVAELFGNIGEHANSPLDGFVAVQIYKRKRQSQIQTVISDNGEGIVATLRKVLAERYPDLERAFAESIPDSDALLLKYVFEKGSISSALNNVDKSRGLGLKRSRDIAADFNATICIRQEHFELTMNYRDNRLISYSILKDLLHLKGTHICFDFYIE